MNISKKLFLSLVGLTSIVLLSTLLLARWSFQQGFLDFISALEEQRLSRVANEIAQAYDTAGGNWQKVSNRDLAIMLQVAPNQMQQSKPPRGPRRGPQGDDLRPRPPGPGGRPPPRDAGQAPHNANIYTALFSLSGELISGAQIPSDNDEFSNIHEQTVLLGDVPIGLLKSWNNDKFGSSIGSRFSQQQLFTSLYIGIASLILAAVLSFYWSKTLLTPMKTVITGIQALSKGDYSNHIAHTRKDEFGTLIDDLNSLAHTLTQTKEAKNRWFADISHELRTPLSVLLGELEALQMGIRPLNAEQIVSLQQEAMLLKRLIEDLYQLSISDIGALRYEYANFDLSEVATRQCNHLQEQAQEAGTKLHFNVAEKFTFKGDENRISQLLGNLLVNSIKYTDAGGHTYLTLERQDNTVVIVVEDSAPSVLEHDCEHLFDPLFRTEKSRNRAKGGAGLGLAICKNIVIAHHGNIHASPSSLGGLRIEVSLPINRVI